MKFQSTNQNAPIVSAREAVLNGLAPDGGLYVPCEVPCLSKSFWKSLSDRSLPEIGFEIARAYLSGDVSDAVLRDMVSETLSFEIPLVHITDRLSVLELFHGPTLAFKDVGARFTARLMGHFVQSTPLLAKEGAGGGQFRELTILVATSGDTGSAVANGFHNVPGIRVVILYPKGRVSMLQEKQMTTLGGNISALEVDGSFDDCQRMVKEAFMDADLQNRFRLTSANSINIARLIPQMFYHVWARSQSSIKQPLVMSVPSGNFGNITAGLIAKRMGMPVDRFIAATNMNDVVPEYLERGVYAPRPSVATISNAMDVGSPSNFARMQWVFENDVRAMRKEMIGTRVSEEETKQTMREVFDQHAYMLDPHGAVAYSALASFLASHPEAHGIVFATAHPAKFQQVVEETLHTSVELPIELQACLKKESHSVKVSSTLDALKAWLLGS